MPIPSERNDGFTAGVRLLAAFGRMSPFRLAVILAKKKTEHTFDFPACFAATCLCEYTCQDDMTRGSFITVARLFLTHRMVCPSTRDNAERGEP
jgi:hypothetical protein